jgi:AraC-like DNA-binding protein
MTSPQPRRSPDLERILIDPTQSFHWNEHDFPSDLARWNYHPELEIHLIRTSSGKAFVGDHIGQFGPGNLVLVGPNLPHHWESDRRPRTVIPLRDVALHFDVELIRRATPTFPELVELEPLLRAARLGLEFHGETARRGAALLEQIGAEPGLRRLLLFFELLRGLSRSSEHRALASPGYVPDLDREAPKVVQRTMDYILQNLGGEVRMAEAARRTRMTEPTFCRFFKRNTGNRFVDYVRKLRIGAACRLLTETPVPVTDVCYEVGYRNISNFNRCFRREKGLTPSQYRRLAAQGRQLAEAGPEGAMAHWPAPARAAAPRPG